MSPRSRRGSIFACLLLASAVTFTVSSVVGDVPVAGAAGLGAGGEYHPLPPTRIFDSRAGSPINSNGAALSTAANGGAADVKVLGLGGIPAAASEVLAVAVSFTVVNPQRAGFLTVYPSGSSPGTSSVLNFGPGQTVPNLSVLTLGANGNVTVKISGNVGTADVLVDVFGWFSTSTSSAEGARLIPVSPGRIFDSREPAFVASAAPLGQGETVVLPIRGADAKNPNITDIVPSSNEVTGVVVNVTGINDLPGSSNTFVSVVPENPSGAVTTSNLNLVPGQVKANLVIVPVGADGAIRLYNNAGSTHLAVDVVGYMRGNQNAATRLGRVVPLTSPFRTFDTRQQEFGNVPLGAGQAETWSFDKFVASVTLDNQPVGKQIAIIGNLTGTSLTRSAASIPANTYFTMYPSDATRPLSSNINVTEGADVPNLAVVKLSANNSIDAYNNAGNIHYIFDAAAVVLTD